MKFFSLCFVLFFIFGCSQNKQEMNLNLAQNSEITSKNIIEKVTNDIKEGKKMKSLENYKWFFME